MNTKAPDIESWRQCLGMCMICGQPMGLKTKWISQEQKEYEVDIGDESDSSTLKVIEDQIERMLLVEECPVRMAFIKFNMLGEHQDCHVIDQYTFLEKKSREESFPFLLRKYEESLISIDKPGTIFKTFIEQAFEKPTSNIPSKLIEKAIAMCKRLGDSLLVAGCRRCNMCMNKPNFHVDTVYRCFPLTKSLDNASLESRQSKAIKIKKIIQQIAFFFEYTILNSLESSDSAIIEWSTKKESDIVRDIDLWRCISNLCYWGRSSKYRYRLIAIFHASHYLYETSTMKSILPFHDWHLHFFRELYMSTFKANTWFGMKEGEAGLAFDLSKKNGDEWKSIVLSRMALFEGKLIDLYGMKDLIRIRSLNEKIKKNVWSEKTLLSFLSSKDSIEDGCERLLDFFKYNISLSVREKEKIESCKKFQRYLCSSYRNTHMKPSSNNQDIYEA